MVDEMVPGLTEGDGVGVVPAAGVIVAFFPALTIAIHTTSKAYVARRAVEGGTSREIRVNGSPKLDLAHFP